MKLSVLLPAVLTVGGLVGCLGGSETGGSGTAGNGKTERKLLEAYSTLQAAAEEVPDSRLPRPVVVKPGGDIRELSDPDASGPADSLVDYFAAKGLTFALAILKEGQGRGLAFRALETEAQANRGITLIVRSQDQYATAKELLEAGATFAAISQAGNLYCIDSAKTGVRSCHAPALPAE